MRDFLFKLKLQDTCLVCLVDTGELQDKCLVCLVDTRANVTILSKMFIDVMNPSLAHKIAPVNINSYR
jgi:hypothetical protein